MVKNLAHKHTFDVHRTWPTMVACTQCGFACPAIILKSRTSLDAHVMRQHCTQAVLDLLSIDRDGQPAVTHS
jgi:hypothetical protein